MKHCKRFMSKLVGMMTGRNFGIDVGLLVVELRKYRRSEVHQKERAFSSNFEDKIHFKV